MKRNENEIHSEECLDNKNFIYLDDVYSSFLIIISVCFKKETFDCLQFIRIEINFFFLLSFLFPFFVCFYFVVFH